MHHGTATMLVHAPFTRLPDFLMEQQPHHLGFILHHPHDHGHHRQGQLHSQGCLRPCGGGTRAGDASDLAHNWKQGSPS
eukprot:3376471-Amphidinium_carterae.1